MFLSVSARSPIFPKYTSLIKNILVVTSKRAIDEGLNGVVAFTVNG